MIGPLAARTPPAAPAEKAASAPVRPSAPAQPAPSGTVAVPAFDVARLKHALEAARAEVDGLILQFKEGAKANAAAFRTARLELARAKLQALKLAAAVNAVRGDAKAARRVAEEAARVARQVKGLRRESKSADAAEPASAGEAGSPPAPTPIPADEGFAAAADSLVQAARKVIAIARKAAVAGSAEDEAMAALQRRTGIPDPAADVVDGLDLALGVEDGLGLDLVA